MIEDGNCPVCEAHEWEEAGRKVYTRAAMEDGDNYLRLRGRVLFEVWFPGRSEVELRAVVCRRCGFVQYFPRPEAKDLDEKYNFLGREDTEEEPEGGLPERINSRRAADLYGRVARHLPRGRARILDFGGETGRLMRPFVRAGHECFMLDYSAPTEDGVVHLGRDFGELEPGAEFDAVVCSHVLEHLADPAGVVRRLYGVLRAGGLLYAEVPLEIRGGVPLGREPVTHVNYFAAPAFRHVLERGGFSVRECRQGVFVYGNARPRRMVYAVAEKGAAKAGAPPGDAYRHVRGLLRPSPAARAADAARHLAYLARHPGLYGPAAVLLLEKLRTGRQRLPRR